MEVKNITVIGLGFVGLPLSLSFALKGCPVIGVDANKYLVDNLNCGKTENVEKYQGKTIDEILREVLAKGNFKASLSYDEAFRVSNSYIITVGIEVYDKMPDFRQFKAALKELGKGLKKGDLVLIRSTVVPGTTEEVAKPILENESGLRAGSDFYLAYASERIAEGRAFEEFENMPTVVAGLNSKSAECGKQLLKLITKADIYVASEIRVVETAKLFENISRDVNIAMVNQFAQFCQELGINTFETIQMANTHKRVNLLMPGPGVGGYCLPNAFYYLLPKQAELGVNLSLLNLAREINDEIPKRIVDRIERRLTKKGKSLDGASMAVLGLAMKDYSNDDRISPTYDVCSYLLEGGASVKAWDPVVNSSVAYAVDDIEEALHGADGLVVLVKQKAFESLDLKNIKARMNNAPVLFDSKCLFDKQEAENLGFDYFSI